MNRVQLAAVCICFGMSAAVVAETPAASQGDAFVDLSTFFRGHWRCSGHFTNGKLISANESFDPVLSGGWVLQIHDDDPPFQYHAYSMWGVDKQSGDLLVTIHDVTGGLRLFRSSMWTAPSFVLEAVPIPGKSGTSERFTYERNGAGAFSFEYAIRKGTGDWVAVDRSDCTRTSPATVHPRS